MAAQSSPSIKAGARALVRRLLSHDALWRAVRPVAGGSAFLSVQRQVAVESRFEAKRERFFARGEVIAGPFAGIAYPEVASFGSALFPKLLGVYESELFPTLEALHGTHYEAIIDIGFAEGYYLAGLGRRHGDAALLGVDISPEAHRLCTGLLRHNGIAAQRVRLAYDASPSTLQPLLERRALAVIDCEGFEAELLTRETVALWRRADLIIECHDFLRSGISDTLKGLLQESHDITVIAALAPEKKLAHAPRAAREAFAKDELIRLVSEGRPAGMQWIVARSRL